MLERVICLAKIKEVKAREILDSRGNPTVEVDVYSLGRKFRKGGSPVRRVHWSCRSGGA